ncbi:universal stress protein [Natrialbaceae archaeon GCM10025810]|uniref:universal stress protein n=1 Tax=Halovalidus salilacus TaxID=3075124 RepID=UPI003605D538
MAEHVLVLYDDSASGREALEYALSAFTDGRITVLRVFEPVERHRDADRIALRDERGGARSESAERESDSTLLQARKRALEQDRRLFTAREAGDPPRVVDRYVDEHDVDRVIVGDDAATGVSRLFESHVVEAVARRLSVPVTVV